MKNKKIFRQLLEDNNFEYLLKGADPSFITTSSLLDARIRKGISQAKLASLVGMQQAAIARLENPGYSVKYLHTLEKIAKALDCDFIPPQLKERAKRKKEISSKKQNDTASVIINIEANNLISVEGMASKNVSQYTSSFKNN